jgi:hypothetical protein
VPRWQLTPRHVAWLNEERRTLGVLPTGWPGGAASGAPQGGGGDGDGGGDGGATDDAAAALLRCVPYSLHAPFRELAALVAALRPRAVAGVVAAPRFPERPTDPRLHFAHLLLPPSPGPPRALRMQSAPQLGADADAGAPAAQQQQPSPRARSSLRAGRQPLAALPLLRVCPSTPASGSLAADLAACAAAAFALAPPRRRAGAGLRIGAPAPYAPPALLVAVKLEAGGAPACAKLENACAAAAQAQPAPAVKAEAEAAPVPVAPACALAEDATRSPPARRRKLESDC